MPRKKQRKHHRRRLSEYDYEPVRLRLVYLCDLLFGSDAKDMAFALDMNYRELDKVFRGVIRVTLRLAMHVATKLDVRTDWLLCGLGTLRRTDCEVETLQLPAKLQPAFPAFDTAFSSEKSTLPLPVKHMVVANQPSDMRPYLQAGLAVYHARSNDKLLGFFLGDTAFACGIAQHVPEFYKTGFANFLCVTLKAACFDLAAHCVLTHIDVNSLAVTAANRGIGYGEAICRAAVKPVCNQSQSVLALVHDIGAPVVVAVELGEVSAHTAAGLRGAETGAAIGAAAYTDLLILTQQLQAFFGSPGGVLIMAGEHIRGIRLVMQRIESLRISVSQPAGFTFVVFAPLDEELETLIQQHGGRVIFLGHPTTAAVTQLFQTCTDAYAGKI